MSLKQRMMNVNNPNDPAKARKISRKKYEVEAKVKKIKFSKQKSTTVVSKNQLIKGTDDLLAIAESIEWPDLSEASTAQQAKDNQEVLDDMG